MAVGHQVGRGYRNSSTEKQKYEGVKVVLGAMRVGEISREGSGVICC